MGGNGSGENANKFFQALIYGVQVCATVLTKMSNSIWGSMLGEVLCTNGGHRGDGKGCPSGEGAT